MAELIRDRDGALIAANIAMTSHFDAIGRVHFRSGSLTARAAARFAIIQEAFLKGHLMAPSPPVLAALSLILFDGIAVESDLALALASLDQIYRWGGQNCLDWTDSIGRQNRRFIGPITQAVLALPRKTAIDVGATLQKLDLWLKDFVRSPNRSYSLELLSLDAQAWLRERLPDPLFAHCICKAPITALSRLTLARHESRLALSPAAGEPAEEPSSRALACAMDSYFASRRDDQGGWFIAELVQSCRRKRALSNAEDKQRMLRECDALASRDIDIAPTGGLILAWVIDLLQSGTRTKFRLKAITPAKYVSIAAKRLWDTFRGQDVEELSATDFQRIYLGMMDGLSNAQKRTLASALSSWHFFLSCWFDVAPLYRSLHRWVPISAPKANIIWPHEMEMIRNWLITPMPDVRHHAQLRVAFEIASSIRIRATELLNLRLQNLHFSPSSLTVEIATKAADGGVKTLAAYRRDQTHSAAGVAMIKAWCQRREHEGAYPGDYLFGDPHRPEVKYASGLLYADLNRLLKAATGDSTIAMHALSHTRISIDWSALAQQDSPIDLNPFERESVDAGHASAATGFACYFHLFEAWLRASLDQGIHTHYCTWSCISERVAKNADAYRQARSRSRRQNASLSREAFAQDFIKQACPVLLLPSASEGVALSEARNPIAPAPPKPFSLSAILDVLNDIEAGHSAEAIALRSDRSVGEIAEVALAAIEALQGIGELDWRKVTPIAKHAVLELHRCLQTGIRERIQFKRAGQPKASLFYDLIASGRQPEIIASGIDAWQRGYRGGYLSLEQASTTQHILALLDAAGYPRHLILIRGIPPLERTVMAAFRAGNLGLPEWGSTQARPGRPKAYLILASHSPVPGNGKLVGNAALGMGGVHAVMFAAAVQRRVVMRWNPPQLSAQDIYAQE